MIAAHFLSGSWSDICCMIACSIMNTSWKVEWVVSIATVIPVRSCILNSITPCWSWSSRSPTAAAISKIAEVCRPESYSEESPSEPTRSAMLLALACLFSRRAALTLFGAAPSSLILLNSPSCSSSSFLFLRRIIEMYVWKIL